MKIKPIKREFFHFYVIMRLLKKLGLRLATNSLKNSNAVWKLNSPRCNIVKTIIYGKKSDQKNWY